MRNIKISFRRNAMRQNGLHMLFLFNQLYQTEITEEGMDVYFVLKRVYSLLNKTCLMTHLCKFIEITTTVGPQIKKSSTTIRTFITHL